MHIVCKDLQMRKCMADHSYICLKKLALLLLLHTTPSPWVKPSIVAPNTHFCSRHPTSVGLECYLWYCVAWTWHRRNQIERFLKVFKIRQISECHYKCPLATFSVSFFFCFHGQFFLYLALEKAIKKTIKISCAHQMFMRLLTIWWKLFSMLVINERRHFYYRFYFPCQCLWEYFTACRLQLLLLCCCRSGWLLSWVS